MYENNNCSANSNIPSQLLVTKVQNVTVFHTVT